MEVWQIWGVVGLLLIIVEMFTPVLFFLNLALAAILTGAATLYLPLSPALQVVLFAVSATLLVCFFRPILLKFVDAPDKTGMNTYLGQEAKVTQKITAESGRIAIFGEAWDARSANGDEINENETVKIISRDGLTMFVEKI